MLQELLSSNPNWWLGLEEASAEPVLAVVLVLVLVLVLGGFVVSVAAEERASVEQALVVGQVLVRACRHHHHSSPCTCLGCHKNRC